MSEERWVEFRDSAGTNYTVRASFVDAIKEAAEYTVVVLKDGTVVKIGETFDNVRRYILR